MAYVIVDTWSSRCSACNGNADQNERFHIHGGPGGMWEPGSDLGTERGCGARFDRVVDPYGRVLEIRPPRYPTSRRCSWHSGCDQLGAPGDLYGYCAGHVAVVSGRAVAA